MIDYTELVKALRCGEYKPECGSSDCPYWSGLGCMDGQACEDAAAAIEALQAEQKKTVTQIFGEEQMAWEGRCKDLMKHISDLQAEVEEQKQIAAHYEHTAKDYWKEACEYKAQLPKRKLGRWEKAKPKGVVVYSDGYAECSSCHEVIWLGWGMNFCPHCGEQNRIIDPDDMAKMEGMDANRPD